MTGEPDASEEDAARPYRLSFVVGCENGAAGEVSERLGLEPERVLDGRKYRRGDTWVWEARIPPGGRTLAREIVARFGVIAERADRIPERLLETTVVSVSIFLDEAGESHVIDPDAWAMLARMPGELILALIVSYDWTDESNPRRTTIYRRHGEESFELASTRSHDQDWDTFWSQAIRRLRFQIERENRPDELVLEFEYTETAREWAIPQADAAFLADAKLPLRIVVTAGDEPFESDLDVSARSEQHSWRGGVTRQLRLDAGPDQSDIPALLRLLIDRHVRPLAVLVLAASEGDAVGGVALF